MRRFIISLALVVGFSCQAGQISAASIKTFARVNIVPGAYSLLSTDPGATTSQVSISGSAIKNSSVQVTVPGLNTAVSSPGQDIQDMLSFDLTLGMLDDTLPTSSGRIISVVFE